MDTGTCCLKELWTERELSRQGGSLTLLVGRSSSPKEETFGSHFVSLSSSRRPQLCRPWTQLVKAVYSAFLGMEHLQLGDAIPSLKITG